MMAQRTVLHDSKTKSPTDVTSNKCAICQSEKSLSQNYGVRSCKACARFFSVHHHSPASCARDGNCEMTEASRKNCSFCRYKKCVDAGMTKARVRKKRIVGDVGPKPEVKEDILQAPMPRSNPGDEVTSVKETVPESETFILKSNVKDVDYNDFYNYDPHLELDYDYIEEKFDHSSKLNNIIYNNVTYQEVFRYPEFYKVTNRLSNVEVFTEQETDILLKLVEKSNFVAGTDFESVSVENFSSSYLTEDAQNKSRAVGSGQNECKVSKARRKDSSDQQLTSDIGIDSAEPLNQGDATIPLNVTRDRTVEDSSITQDTLHNSSSIPAILKDLVLSTKSSGCSSLHSLSFSELDLDFDNAKSEHETSHDSEKSSNVIVEEDLHSTTDIDLKVVTQTLNVPQLVEKFSGGVEDILDDAKDKEETIIEETLEAIGKTSGDDENMEKQIVDNMSKKINISNPVIKLARITDTVIRQWTTQRKVEQKKDLQENARETDLTNKTKRPSFENKTCKFSSKDKVLKNYFEERTNKVVKDNRSSMKRRQEQDPSFSLKSFKIPKRSDSNLAAIADTVVLADDYVLDLGVNDELDFGELSIAIDPIPAKSEVTKKSLPAERLEVPKKKVSVTKTITDKKRFDQEKPKEKDEGPKTKMLPESSKTKVQAQEGETKMKAKEKEHQSVSPSNSKPDHSSNHDKYEKENSNLGKEDKQVHSRLSICFKFLSNRCKRSGGACRFGHTNLADKSVSDKHCIELTQRILQKEYYSVAWNICEMCRGRPNPKVTRILGTMILDDLLDHNHHVRAVEYWEKVSSFNVNDKKLVELCETITPTKLQKLLLHLHDSKLWFAFWKLMQHTQEKNLDVSIEIIGDALDALSQNPHCIKMAVPVFLYLHPLTCCQFEANQIQLFLSNVRKFGGNMHSIVRMKLNEYCELFPTQFALFKPVITEMYASPSNAVNGGISNVTSQTEELNLTPSHHSGSSFGQNVCIPSASFSSDRAYVSDLPAKITVKHLCQWMERNEWDCLAKHYISLMMVVKDLKSLNDFKLAFTRNQTKVAQYFSCFLDCLKGKLNSTHQPRWIRYLAQLGVGLVLESYSQLNYEQAFELLKVLHNANINYLELQRNDHNEAITLNEVALVAVEVCIRMRRFTSALGILRDAKWIMPCCFNDVHIKERLDKAKLLVQLTEGLLSIKDFSEAHSTLTKLLSTYNEDIVQLNTGEYLHSVDLGNLSDKVIAAIMNQMSHVSTESRDLDMVVKIYQRILDLHISLDPASLRALFVTMKHHNMPAFCANVFSFCCNLGIYPRQNVIDWTWCVTIYSYLLPEEICYILETYLHKIVGFLSSPENQNNLVYRKPMLHINLEQMTFESEVSIDILNVDSSLEGITDRVVQVAMHGLISPLNVIVRGSNRILDVTTDSLQQYFHKKGIENVAEDLASVATTNAWPSFRKPRVKVQGYSNPFGGFGP